MLFPATAIAIVLAVVGLVVGCLVGLVLDALHSLPANYFGLCTGGGGSDDAHAGSTLDRDPPEPLSYWLADFIDELGGIHGPKPLTFGDLWNGPEEPSGGTPPASHAVRHGCRGSG